MTKGRRTTHKNEPITATLEDFLNAQPTIERLLLAPYDRKRQAKQIDLSQRLQRLQQRITDAREDSAVATIQQKLMRDGGQQDGQRWYFTDPEKERAMHAGLRQVNDTPVTISAPIISVDEIDGAASADGKSVETILDPQPPLTAGERAAIDFLLTYPDPVEGGAQ